MRVTIRWILSLPLLAGLLAGCHKASTPPVASMPPPAAPSQQVANQAPATAAPASQQPGHDPQAQHILRGREKRIVENDFKQLGLQIQQYASEFGKAPSNKTELGNYIKRDMPSAYRAIMKGDYVVVPNARLGANTVMVYEKDIDINGNQVVLFGDGSVQTLQAQDLQKALKNPGG